MRDTKKLCAMSLQSCPTHWTPWTVAHQTPLSMGFSRQEYWSGCPFSSLGDVPDPGSEAMFPEAPASQANLHH